MTRVHGLALKAAADEVQRELQSTVPRIADARQAFVRSPADEEVGRNLERVEAESAAANGRLHDVLERMKDLLELTD